ncbi:PREDICTED: RAB6-interacting golgin [Nicrophorus vespilloides]|uniref:RAB6-interacting golgin n=1 Tax=Nicrophorus vespilloides TaxID=110193 RepID=A0ABM1MNH6_NICVS|nr:PREDICTED: RAB6-interacting golgin [Nicrophorus vespilloides]
MSGFTGFSEADIRKVQNGQSPTKSKLVANHKQSTLNQPKKLNQNDAKTKQIMDERITKIEATPIPEEAKLTPKPEEAKIEEKPIATTTVQSITNEDKPTVQEQKLNIILDDCTDKKKNLEEFEAKQKLIEEQNRRRKELLIKALADRTQKTIKEQQKLNDIQEEFKKLDANLSNDVKVLRKQIENASLDYMEAQKKYLRAEKEFLDAKLYLHQKQERKDLLTEYLCAIIEKNEERKATKLTELLQKLELEEP